ncbi:MAG: DUF2752 domain-containing protein [Acidobacteria bacterium]|nr:DUF2752 domain-containing protein [Acidobacteriota bacterium]
MEASQIATRSERLMAAAGVAVMTFGAWLVWFVDPVRASFLPVCPLYKMTGYACPGCGLTRGFHALFHGDIVGAMDFNLLIPLFVVIFGYLYISMFLVMVRGRAFPKWTLSLGAVWGLLGVLLVFGILRNIPAYPFSWMFP